MLPEKLWADLPVEFVFCAMDPGLCVRITKVFNPQTVGDLVRLKPIDFFRKKGIGRRTVKRLHGAIKACLHGLPEHWEKLY